MKLSELTSHLETLAPLAYQEDYDNAGLIVGHPDKEISSALISLDCTEAVLDEAIHKGCDVVVSHHPVIFSGLKKLNGKNHVERIVIKAIKHDIALYAIHTNLDNVATGVNKQLCDELGVLKPVVLKQKDGSLKKLVTFCPDAYAEKVRKAMFEAGAGWIGNYSECSFNTWGTGTFKAEENTNPFVGEAGKNHSEPEIRIETIYPANLEKKVTEALVKAHPYEEVSYDLYPVSNPYPSLGSGMVGELGNAMDELNFLELVKEKLKAKVIRHSAFRGKKIKCVAVCGGSGSFLLNDAIRAGADAYISSDFKYHEFFNAENKILITDTGHFESEQFTQNLLLEIIQKKFPTFALHLTEENTNPINYFI